MKLAKPTRDAVAQPDQLLKLLMDMYTSIQELAKPILPSRAPNLKSITVETLTDLRKLVGDATGEAGPRAVLLVGGTAPNDSLAGTWTWDAMSTAADDGRTVINGGGVTVGRWKNLTATLKTQDSNAINSQAVNWWDDDSDHGDPFILDFSASKQSITNPFPFQLKNTAGAFRQFEIDMTLGGGTGNDVKTLTKYQRTTGTTPGTIHPGFGFSEDRWLENGNGVPVNAAQVTISWITETGGAETSLIAFSGLHNGAATGFGSVSGNGFDCGLVGSPTAPNFSASASGVSAGLWGDSGGIVGLTDGTNGFVIGGGANSVAFGAPAAAGVPHSAVGLGATLTNNITPGGVANVLTNWTNLTVYATDAAAIRNAIYQLGLKLSNLEAEAKAFGPYIT